MNSLDTSALERKQKLLLAKKRLEKYRDKKSNSISSNGSTKLPVSLPTTDSRNSLNSLKSSSESVRIEAKSGSRRNSDKNGNEKASSNSINSRDSINVIKKEISPRESLVVKPVTQPSDLEIPFYDSTKNTSRKSSNLPDTKNIEKNIPPTANTINNNANLPAVPATLNSGNTVNSKNTPINTANGGVSTPPVKSSDIHSVLTNAEKSTDSSHNQSELEARKLNETIDKLKDEIKAKDENIKELTESQQSHETNVQIVNFDNEKLRSRVGELESQLSQRENELKENYYKFVEKDQLIERMSGEVGSLRDELDEKLKGFDSTKNENEKLVREIEELNKKYSTVIEEKKQIENNFTAFIKQVKEKEEMQPEKVDGFTQCEVSVNDIGIETTGIKQVSVLTNTEQWIVNNTNTQTDFPVQSSQSQTTSFELLPDNISNDLKDTNSPNQAEITFQAEITTLKSQLLQTQKINEQLQMELETLPHYITKYHQERRILKGKSFVKDKVLVKLCEEYERVCFVLEKVFGKTENTENDNADVNGGLDLREIIRELKNVKMDGFDLIRIVEDVMREEKEELLEVEMEYENRKSLSNLNVVSGFNRILESRFSSGFNEVLIRRCEYCDGEMFDY